MELWALLHFLMPNVFASHDDFKEWFHSPITGMVDGTTEVNHELVRRLHKVVLYI
jgi:E1A-binding protein p400